MGEKEEVVETEMGEFTRVARQILTERAEFTRAARQILTELVYQNQCCDSAGIIMEQRHLGQGNEWAFHRCVYCNWFDDSQDMIDEDDPEGSWIRLGEAQMPRHDRDCPILRGQMLLGILPYDPDAEIFRDWKILLKKWWARWWRRKFFSLSLYGPDFLFGWLDDKEFYLWRGNKVRTKAEAEKNKRESDQD